VRGDKKFAAYLCFCIGISLCGIEWERVEKKPVSSRAFQVVTGGKEPTDNMPDQVHRTPDRTYNRRIYPDRAAFEKDKEVFLKTICAADFDGWMLGGRGYDCL